MPLTTLDPNTALIGINLQEGIVNGNFIHPIGDIIDRARAGPDGTGSAQQHIVFRGMDRLSAAARSATERYCRHKAKLGRIRNNGS